MGDGNDNIIRCDKCGSIISEREIALYRGLVMALFRVFRHVTERGEGNRFTRKEVKHLFKNENDTARFGDWFMFGGLMIKEGKGNYLLSINRCRAFFYEDYKIPTRVWKNPVTEEIRAEDYKTLSEIPSIMEKLNEAGFYEWKYREPVGI